MNTIVNKKNRLKKSYTPLILAALLLPACYVETGEPGEELVRDTVAVDDPAIVLERNPHEWVREVDEDVVSPEVDAEQMAADEAVASVDMDADEAAGEFCAAEETACGSSCCGSDEACERRLHPIEHRIEYRCVCEGPDCVPLIDPVQPLIPSPWPGPVEEPPVTR